MCLVGYFSEYEPRSETEYRAAAETYVRSINGQASISVTSYSIYSYHELLYIRHIKPELYYSNFTSGLDDACGPSMRARIKDLYWSIITRLQWRNQPAPDARAQILTYFI